MIRLLWLLLLLPLPAVAEHAMLVYQREDDQAPLTLTHLSGTPATYQVNGLPFPGEVLWRPATQATEAQLAYRHPAEGSWLLATPNQLPVSAVSTTSLPGAPGPASQGQATRRWAQSVGRKDCGVLFGAPSLGRQYGLNLADFQHLYRLLYWLNAAQLPTDCANAQTLPATAPQVGLPTRWASPLGLLLLQEIRLPGESPTAMAWPKVTYPVTPEVQLRLLLAQLSVPARAEFLQQFATLPLALQVERLAAILAAETAQALGDQ
ncbi:MAG: hypothetical protein INF43_03935 [Alphaproteobacteria bacterium]|nr:hypothetical protein [Alphaproteobacteria bacterium]